MTFTATIPGRPQPKQRPRHGKGFTFTPTATKVWETAAAMLLRNAAQGVHIEGPCRVEVAAYWQRPKARPSKVDKATWGTGLACFRTGTPDADNVLKAVMDAGNQANIWGDDAQVVIAQVVKRYAAKGDRPRVVVTVTKL